MKKILIPLALSLFLVFAGCEDDSNITTEPELLQKEANFGDNEGKLEKGSGYAQFKVTLENLTPATGPGASQPLSPPVITTHTPKFHIFQKHKYASSELAYIAEDAFNDPLVELLNSSPLAYDVVVGSSGPVFPGSAETFMVKAKFPFKKLSLVTMLVNTNDGFTGIDAANLPLFGTREYYLPAYDAGSEKNTELTSHIPGPCCGSPFVRVPSNKIIKKHKGIKGKGDLDPGKYGWKGYVAKLTITRVK